MRSNNTLHTSHALTHGKKKPTNEHTNAQNGQLRIDRFTVDDAGLTRAGFGAPNPATYDLTNTPRATTTVESTRGISEMPSQREFPRWATFGVGVRYSFTEELRVYPEIIRNPPLVQFWIRRAPRGRQSWPSRESISAPKSSHL